MEVVFKYIQGNSDLYVKRLAEAVAIPSVSSDPERRNECIRMMHYTSEIIQNLGGKTRLVDLGKQNFEDGSVKPLPPVILGEIGHDSKKKTLCVYGHLDVQPALKSDGWNTDPFVLTEVEGKLFGRGSTDDKGPALGWLWAVEAFQKTGVELPVNLKFVFEGMEESGSIGLEQLIKKEAQSFLKNVDYFTISDNYWLGQDNPCITYGLRGLCCWFLTIESSKKDLHSGLFGGSVPECMTDLIALLSKLVDNKGKIMIPGVMDSVVKVTQEETDLYSKIKLDLQEYAADAGVKKALHETSTENLMSRWRFPSLSIHGIEGAFHESGIKTVIPKKVIGKFSMRLVPNQTPAEINKLCEKYLKEEFAKLKSLNKMTLGMEEPCNAWVSDVSHPNYVAAANAIRRVYKKEPIFTREGGSVPITISFEQSTGKNCVLLPIGQSDDGAHSQNEKISRKNYISGIQLFAAYMDEISKVSVSSPEKKKRKVN
eukprot:Sdes_comp20437_c1_seq1m14594